MTKEEKAIAVIEQFHDAYPFVKCALMMRDNRYVLVLDYSFTNLTSSKQALGREGLNTLLYALRGIGLPVHLELGYI